jgi:hypothetical protein
VFEDPEPTVQPTSLLNADPRQALDLVHEKQADDFNEFLVDFLQHEPIDNDNDITMFPRETKTILCSLYFLIQIYLLRGAITIERGLDLHS